MRTFSGTALRAQRVRSGLSVAELAARTGRSAWTLYDYEAGRAQPPIRVATALADALGLRLDQLLARAEMAAA
ncbi:helix-turn-helix domain-containing protein [Streptomyces sp. NPDC059618]|uniref:helix-turn-helix domain-containing protein n=1 Tax=Streptomyces sp. NPDC059618 TaxID=3346887 RepID=UPI0036A81566